jgi:hypothetical protein
MKLRDLLFVVIVVVVVGGLYFLSTRGKARPVPVNPAAHLTAKTREDCLSCHTPEQLGNLELRHKHPGKWKDAKVSCFQCHKAAEGSRALNHSGDHSIPLISQFVR